MKSVHSTLATLMIALLAGCAATDSKPPAPETRPAPPAPATAPETPPPPPAPPPPPPAPAVSSKELNEEAQRLAGMQKAYFMVFKIDESNAGLKARPNAIGVFDLQKPLRGERLRLVVTQQPRKPAKLSVGTYSVALDTVIDYLETQTCKSASCAGKQQKLVRSLAKVYRFQISPQNQYYGGQDVLLTTPGSPGNYRSTYSDIVVTIKRITVTPIMPPASPSTSPGRQE